METVTKLTVAEMDQVGPTQWNCRIIGPEGETLAEEVCVDRYAAWLWCEQKMEELL